MAFGDGAASVLLGVATAADDLDEADGAVTATLQAGAGYRLGTPAAATVTVGDDDPLPALSIADAAGAEADAPLAFAVSLVNAAAPALGSGRAVTVAWATADGSAVAGADYTAVADGTLTFAAGQTGATIEVPLLGDALDEGEETFTVTLSAPRTPGSLLHAALQDAVATGTITDDDTRGVTVSEEALDIDEGASATYTVVLTSQPTDTVTVGVARTADSDPDVTVSPATLTFATGTWNTAQAVTVSGGHDADAADDAATIEHTVSGGDYEDNGVTAADVAVAVDDDETAAQELTLVLTVTHDDVDGSTDVTLGDVLSYTATATNSGNLALSGVKVSDLLVSTGGKGCATLALRAKCELTGTYTVTQGDVDAGQVVNTATATATGLTAETKSVTTAVAQQRSLTLKLSADVGSFAAVGDTITYGYTVTNSGTVTLSGTVTIADDTVAAITCDAVPSSGLAPGGTASCSGTYTTLQADVDASGVASNATASLDGTTSAAATLRVPWAALQGSQSPVLTIAGVDGDEDAGQFAFAVSLSPASLQTVTVAYATADGTATAGADYTGASGTLTFAPGATSRTIAVPVQDDELDEEDESFSVELSAPSDAATPLNATFGAGVTTLTAAATIADDDATPAISSGAFAVAEGQTVVGQLAATDDDQAASDLAWTIPAGTAGGADAEDFTLSPAGALAFAAAKDHENPDDADADGVYAVTVQVSDGTNAATADLTVTLTDVAPAVSIAPVAATVEEGTAAAFTLIRSGDLSGTQAVAVDVSQTGAVLATGQAGARQVTFADGATEAALSAATVDDTVAEAAGTVTATVQTGTGYTVVGASATAQVTVTDNDAGALTLTVQPAEIEESDTATEVTVTATWDAGTRAEATAVTVSVGGGSATSGTDYTAVADITLTIAATESTGTGTFMLTPTQDSVSEGDETIDITGTAGDFTVTKATMTLTDDETAPGTIALTTAPISVREDDSATQVTVTATLGGSVTSSATEVTVSVGGGTAASGTDYTAVADFTLTIAATESTGTGTFTLTPTQDSVSEGDETIDVTGSAGDITVTKAEMTLTDDETAPGTIALTTDPTSVGEDASETEVTVIATLGGSVTLSSATEVTVSVGGGTATSGTDYTAVADITLTIAATESTGTGTFTLTPTQDSVSEGDETIDITGTAGDITVTKAEMTLTDDETAPGTIALTTDPTSVGEDASETEVTVIATLGGSVTLASATEVTVSVGGGTATSGTDYTAVADITLTIAATESTGTGTFTLTPTQDSVSEGDETIDITGTAGDFTVTKAEMTLTDDETAPGTIALTTDPTSVGEDASETEVTVIATLGGSVTLAGATEVTVSVGGGSATSGTDYTAVADITLTIAATESTGTGTFTLTPTQDSVSEGDETIDVTGVATDFTVTKATMTLTDPLTPNVDPDLGPGNLDDDEAAPRITSGSALEAAEGQTAVAQLTATDDEQAPNELTWSIPEGTTGGADAAHFELTGAGVLTFKAAKDYENPDDADADGVYAVTVEVSDADDNAVRANLSVTLTDVAPAVTVAADAASVVEGTAAAFTLTRSADLSGTQTVAVAVSATGTVLAAGESTGERQVSFADGVAEAALSVATDDDAVAEAGGTVTATVQSGTGYTVGTSATAQVTVTDDDERGVSVSPTALTVREGGTGEYTAKLTSQPTDAVTVTVTASGDATVDAQTLSFTTEDWRTAQTVTVTGKEDADSAAGEATIAHVANGGDYVDVAGDTVDVTVTDDDTASTAVTLSVNDTEVAEDSSSGEEIEVTATLDGATLGTATDVTVSVTGGTATAGDDFAAVDDVTVTIAAGEASGTGTFTLAPVNDDVAEADETVTVSGTTTSDLTVTPTAGLTVTITDDDERGVTATPHELTVPEGGTATYEVKLTSQPTDDVTVTVTASGDATVDPGTLSFTTENWSTARTVTVTGSEDADSAAGEASIAHVANGGDYVEVAGDTVSVTVTDDDQPETQIALELDPGTVPEGAGATAITVTARLSPDAQAVSTEVTVSVTGDTATAGADFAAVAPVTLTIAAGQTTGTASFMLTPVDDAVDEADETLAVSGVTAAPELPVTPATLTLGDDDERGVTVQPTELHMRPGEQKSYTVRLSSQPTAPATVRVIVPPDRAADLTVEPATLTYTPATWQTPQTVDVTADSAAAAGTTRLELEHAVTGGDYDHLPAQPVEVSITGDETDGDPPEDDPPDENPPALSIADARAAESAGQMAFTVQLAAASGRLVTVDYATVSGTATEGTDYTGTTGTLTFRPGGALTRTIAVPIVDDALDEVDETFRMRLSGARHATLAGGGATLAATGTILDDDEPAVSIVADVAAVQEGQAARFTVTRTGHATEPLTVTVEVTETGSVIAGAVPVRVSFEANVRTATLVVATEDDTIDEPDGAVTAAIVAGGGYVTMDPASATVTISDNDAAPALTIADARVLESAGEIEFTVRMAAASGHRVTVVCVSEDGTALADQDYEGEVGILALEPGQTVGKIRVAVLDDTLDEMDETFTMVLSDPAHATLADGTATGTIEDDDPSVAKAWLSRFGRTVATHVMDAVGGRLAEAAGQGSQASVAGRRLEPAADVAPSDWFEPASFRTMEFRELLAGSSLDLTAVQEDEAGGGEGGRWTAWGRGGATRFTGKEGELSVGGTVAGGVVGADYEWGRMLAGLSAAYSGGGGDFTVRGTGAARDRTGDVGSWLLSAHPYVRVEVSDRLAAWALAGYGVGRMSLDEDARDVETGISMTMGAFAARGVLLSPEQNGGLSLAMKSDGFLLRIASEAADELPAAAAEVQRVRLVLDGSVDVLRGPGGVLTPSLQVGGRYDGGDAETGLGLEVGGGLRYSYPEWGLTVQANGRLLLSHEDRDYEEWGAGGSIRIAPGSQGRGLSVGLNTSWGAVASGVERLWSQGAARPTGGAAADDAAGPPGRLEAELGYGIDALGGGGLLTPYAGVTLGDGGDNTYRLGGRLDIGSFSLGLEADRSQSAGALPEHELRLTGTVRW